jgi:hypothetical protein
MSDKYPLRLRAHRAYSGVVHAARYPSLPEQTRVQTACGRWWFMDDTSESKQQPTCRRCIAKLAPPVVTGDVCAEQE